MPAQEELVNALHTVLGVEPDEVAAVVFDTYVSVSFVHKDHWQVTIRSMNNATAGCPSSDRFVLIIEAGVRGYDLQAFGSLDALCAHLRGTVFL